MQNSAWNGYHAFFIRNERRSLVWIYRQLQALFVFVSFLTRSFAGQGMAGIADMAGSQDGFYKIMHGQSFQVFMSLS
jgi:hypothetical protein